MAWRTAIRLGVRLAALALIALAWTHAARPINAAEDDAALAAALQGMVAQADAVGAALDRGDVAAARAAYKQFDDAWFEHEDGVRERSRPDYRAIEQAMDDVQ